MSRGGESVWGRQRRDLISSPSPWKSWAVAQGQWERVCKHLHASETAAGQTERMKTSSWWESVSELSGCCVSAPLQMPLFLPTPWLLYYLCWLCGVFGGSEEGWREEGGSKGFPSPRAETLPVRDSSCCRSASVLGLHVFPECFPCGVSRADCLFLCSRQWKVWAGLKIRVTVWLGWSRSHPGCISFVPLWQAHQMMCRERGQVKRQWAERGIGLGVTQGEVWSIHCEDDEELTVRWGCLWHLACKFVEVSCLISCSISLLCFYWNHPSDTEDETCPTVTSVAFGSRKHMEPKQRGRHSV